MPGRSRSNGITFLISGRRNREMISANVVIKAQFHDLDPMQVVWHGNYVRYLEQARCALLDRIGYNYHEMEASGFAWPVVDLRVKYVRPVRFSQEIVVTAELVEYANRLRIEYRVRDHATNEVLTKATTVQVAVLIATGEMQLESPPALLDRLRGLI
jgi:acyl-CoA thioester hydrolase